MQEDTVEAWEAADYFAQYRPMTWAEIVEELAQCLAELRHCAAYTGSTEPREQTYEYAVRVWALNRILAERKALAELIGR